MRARANAFAVTDSACASKPEAGPLSRASSAARAAAARISGRCCGDSATALTVSESSLPPSESICSSTSAPKCSCSAAARASSARFPAAWRCRRRMRFIAPTALNAPTFPPCSATGSSASTSSDSLQYAASFRGSHGAAGVFCDDGAAAGLRPAGALRGSVPTLPSGARVPFPCAASERVCLRTATRLRSRGEAGRPASSPLGEEPAARPLAKPTAPPLPASLRVRSAATLGRRTWIGPASALRESGWGCAPRSASFSLRRTLAMSSLVAAAGAAPAAVCRRCMRLCRMRRRPRSCADMPAPSALSGLSSSSLDPATKRWSEIHTALRPTTAGRLRWMRGAQSWRAAPSAHRFAESFAPSPRRPKPTLGATNACSLWVPAGAGSAVLKTPASPSAEACPRRLRMVRSAHTAEPATVRPARQRNCDC